MEVAGAMEDAIEEASADADKVAVTSGWGDGAPSVKKKERGWSLCFIWTDHPLGPPRQPTDRPTDRQLLMTYLS